MIGRERRGGRGRHIARGSGDVPSSAQESTNPNDSRQSTSVSPLPVSVASPMLFGSPDLPSNEFSLPRSPQGSRSPCLRRSLQDRLVMPSSLTLHGCMSDDRPVVGGSNLTISTTSGLRTKCWSRATRSVIGRRTSLLLSPIRVRTSSTR